MLIRKWLKNNRFLCLFFLPWNSIQLLLQLNLFLILFKITYPHAHSLKTLYFKFNLAKSFWILLNGYKFLEIYVLEINTVKKLLNNFFPGLHISAVKIFFYFIFYFNVFSFRLIFFFSWRISYLKIWSIFMLSNVCFIKCFINVSKQWMNSS